jgi:hypothetical protein
VERRPFDVNRASHIASRIAARIASRIAHRESLTVRGSEFALELVKQSALGLEEIAHRADLFADPFHRQQQAGRTIARCARQVADRLFDTGGGAVLGLDLGQ